MKLINLCTLLLLLSSDTAIIATVECLGLPRLPAVQIQAPQPLLLRASVMLARQVALHILLHNQVLSVCLFVLFTQLC